MRHRGAICGHEMSSRHGKRSEGPQGGESGQGQTPALEEAAGNIPQRGHSSTAILISYTACFSFHMEIAE